jgi:alpha-glucosidase
MDSYSITDQRAVAQLEADTDSSERLSESDEFEACEGPVLPLLAADDAPVRGVLGYHFAPLGDLTVWERTATGIKAKADDAVVQIDLIDSDVFRISIRSEGSADPAPTYSIVRERSTWAAKFYLHDNGTELQLSTETIRVVIGKAPFRVEAYRTDGSAILQCPTENSLGSFSRLNDEFIVTRVRSSSSSILGLGQKTGGMDRSGRSLILWNTDVLNPRSLKEFGFGYKESDPRGDPRSQAWDPYYISIPFYQTLDRQGRAAGFFIDNLCRADYDFSQPGETRIRFDSGAYEEYVFAGPDLASILRAYTDLTGRMNPPPLWSLGYHHCRWHPYSADDVIQHAKTYRKRGIPCDSIWLDIDHMHGYRVFTWNKKLFPDPKATLAELNDLGFRSVTIVDPGVKVEPGYAVYDSGLERKAFCLTEQGGIYHGQVWPGRTAFPDFATEETREWWGTLNAEHIGMGLSGIWNDMNEPATGDIPDAAMRFGHGAFSHGVYHNGYAMMMAMGTYQGLRKAMPDTRPFILSRAGSAGIQRFAANWLGDNMSRWEHLAMSIPMSLGLGLSGQAFVGADIGGFGENCEPELLVRWFQAACLSPFCRNHNDAGGVDQYPWSFGPEIESHCKAALSLRYMLMPYLYTAFVEASQTGMPVMRPMLIMDPGDPLLRLPGDQYMLGPDLIVAPVVVKGAARRSVTLPEGEWFDWWNGSSASGRRVDADAPLSRVPIYVRAGAVIPMWPEVPATTMDYHPESTDLRVFLPSSDGITVSRLVEDDGTSFAFERGERLETTFTLTRTGPRIRLEGRTVGKPHRGFRRRHWNIRLQGDSRDLDEVIEAPDDGFVWEREL